MVRVAFDVDDTLMKFRREQRDQVPDFALIQMLLWFADNGDEVFIWSGGGVEYAATVARKLGLDQMVSVVPKDTPVPMDITFDDAQMRKGRVNVLVHRPTQPEETTG
jgi:hypothetical protein